MSTTLTIGSAETFKASYAGKTPRAGSRFDLDPMSFHPFVDKSEYHELLGDDARGTWATPRWMVLEGWTDKGGTYHPPAPYIQANPDGRLDRIVLDVDITDGIRHIQSKVYDDQLAPMPNMIVTNRVSTHAQAHYLLKSPVATTDHARRKPLGLAMKVQRGLTAALDADPAYSNSICRSPLNPGHEVVYNRAEGFDLLELAHALGPLMDLDRPSSKPVSGLGRNCALFDTLREWAYANRLRFTVKGEWEMAVRDMAKLQNMRFSEPMYDSEVASVARSVASWTWRKMTAESRARLLHNSRSKGGRTKSVLKDLGYIGAAEKRRKATPEKIMDVLG